MLRPVPGGADRALGSLVSAFLVAPYGAAVRTIPSIARASPPPKRRRWLLWLLGLSIPVFALQYFAHRPVLPVLSYSEFDEQLVADNVVSVTIVDGSSVQAVLGTPVGPGKTAHVTMLLPIKNDPAFLAGLQAHHVRIAAAHADTGMLDFMSSVLPILLMLGFWYWMMKRQDATQGGFAAFAKAEPRAVDPDTPAVTFAQVAGAEEAKGELREIVEFLKAPERFTRLGGKLPKGALLVGPPGTGKTLLARAVAGEAGRPFLSISGSDFVEMIVGVGASRVRSLFVQAKAHAPCIVFIDEIDAVGRQRGTGLGGGHDEREQTLNQMLVEMDGFDPSAGVVVLAATNRPDVLDPALLRPGRFDRQIIVDAPDVTGREAILRVHTASVPLAADVDLQQIARATPGMVGADLANLVNEAAILAARSDTAVVRRQDFSAALDKVTLGLERRSLLLSDRERRLTAYHEAGHAVIGLVVPGADPVRKVTIIPRGRALGVTASSPDEDRHSYTKVWLEGRLAMLFGGRAAEAMMFGEPEVTTGASNDIAQATALARRMVEEFGMSSTIGLVHVGDPGGEVFLGRSFSQRRAIAESTATAVDGAVKALIDGAYAQAVALLTAHRTLLEAIADALLARETIDRDDLLALVQATDAALLASPTFVGTGTPLMSLPQGDEAG
jgi:cell division protease FtsH